MLYNPLWEYKQGHYHLFKHTLARCVFGSYSKLLSSYLSLSMSKWLLPCKVNADYYIHPPWNCKSFKWRMSVSHCNAYNYIHSDNALI